MPYLPSKLFTLWLTVTFLFAACGKKQESTVAGGDEFLRLSNVGKAQLDRGEAAPALAAFEKALSLNPGHPDAQLNLANAALLSEQPDRARQLAGQVLETDRSSAAAYYVAGCADLRLRRYEAAVKFLQQAKDIDIKVNAVSFQLGLAYEGLTNYPAALEQYDEIEKFEPDFPGLHFRLAQVYSRLNQTPEAAAQLQLHQQWLASHPNANLSAAGIAKCKYTEARVPFKLEQPDPKGITVVFTDASAGAFGGAKFSGPVGVIDFAADGRNHLLVRDGESFRVLRNEGGIFRTNDQSFPFTNVGRYTRWLVADLNKDNVPDALVLGDRGVHLYRFATNGTATEATLFAGLRNFAAVDGLFMDLNFRGDLDLVSVDTNGALRVMSNLQNMYFVDTTTNVPTLIGVRQLAVEDWNNDEVQDLFVSRASGAPQLLLKQRGGAWSNAAVEFPTGTALTVADLNNDLRPDLLIASGAALEIRFSGNTERASIPLGGFVPAELKLVDYDNDGWLDIVALGNGLRVWRNLGAKGFRDVTAALGLDPIKGRVDSFIAADFDGDCDTDFLVSIEKESLHFLRNDGGQVNQQLKVQLQGNRSNSSGLGVRLDVAAGGLRVARRVQQLPVEIGVGRHRQIDALNAQWFELSPSYTDLALTNCAPLRIIELSLPTGSCPYLYSWTGEGFRFVTDFLCSAPLGLPVAPGRYIESDEDEFVRVGDEKQFQPRAGNYVLQLTEELREVLYLDEAKLIVVDHPTGTEVHSTGKMLPGKSSTGFGQHELVTLHHRFPLQAAVNDMGTDVTRAVSEIDQTFASPTKLREPQLRGLAEPHQVTVDFGALPAARPLVLALTGWLRFGGGMANIAASSYRDFPFPFPTLEAEVNGTWQRVNVEVGAPAGRGKTILVDLAGRLPAGAKRLRVTAAFEIHWDRIALFERTENNTRRLATFAPTKTDLHRRGYSEMTTLAGTTLLVPDYSKAAPTPLWRVTPGGWATRYGAVDELLAARDNSLALIAAGDELTLEFAAQALPAKAEGMVRDFYLFISGWDKDSDFHVASGTSIEPWPWHGLNDQTYATQPRPAFTNDAWILKYNTRWIGDRVLSHR